MEEPSCKLSEKNHMKLIKWKYDLKCKSMNEIIGRLIKLVVKLNLMEELKGIDKK